MMENKQAVITGGKGDIARAMVTALAATEMQLHAPGRDELDVGDEQKVEQYFSALQSIDLLVCNAGVTDDNLLLKMDESSWDAVLETNLKGAFLTARAAAKKMMKQRGGHIVFISSYSAFHPPMGQVNYAAAKAALKGLALSLARELGSRNIRVNVIVPGYMDTKMTRDVSEATRESALQKQSLGVFNSPEATGKFLRHLHLEMPFTSGQIFNLDSRVL